VNNETCVHSMRWSRNARGGGDCQSSLEQGGLGLVSEGDGGSSSRGGRGKDSEGRQRLGDLECVEKG